MAPTELQAAAPHLTSGWRSDYLKRLLRWFQRHQRDLPWRKTRDPYAIWISESMLQQTQVATVIDYYARFLARFPDVATLAAADLQEVLTLWAGLGYYRRARQLHAAAVMIAEDFAGRFPESVEQLRMLPGVGRYTAGAIASIALDQSAPIVEANTERLYARLLKLEQAPREPTAQRLLWQFAQWQIDSGQHSPGAINQAAMELGSLICKPLKPDCLACPVARLCPTAAAGLQERIPVPAAKKQFTALHHVALVARQGNRWLLRQNPAGAWWHGLWDFPRIDVTALGWSRPITSRGTTQPPLSATQLSALIMLGQQQWCTGPINSGPSTAAQVKTAVREAATGPVPAISSVRGFLFTLSHGVTRYRIRLDCWEAEVDVIQEQMQSTWRWIDAPQLDQLPLTSTAKKMIARLTKA